MTPPIGTTIRPATAHEKVRANLIEALGELADEAPNLSTGELQECVGALHGIMKRREDYEYSTERGAPMGNLPARLANTFGRALEGRV